MRGKDRNGKGKGTDIYDTLEFNSNNLFYVD
jgi:hypothetical protein